MNVFEFFRRWKRGMDELSAEQLLYSKMVGHVGASVGMFFACLYLLFSGSWWFVGFCFFIGFLQVVEFLSVRKQLGVLKEQLRNMKMWEENNRGDL